MLLSVEFLLLSYVQHNIQTYGASLKAKDELKTCNLDEEHCCFIFQHAECKA